MSKAFTEVLNQGQFETWTTKPEMNFYHVTQVHGVELVHLRDLPAEADGLVVSWEKLDQALAIKTADCMPIVLEGKKGVVFLHAGWRGLADGILHRSEIQSIEPMRAFIGPSIHHCCFEVTPDFKDNFPASTHFIQREGKLFFDLQQEARDSIRAAYPNLLVGIAPICTCCHNDFHSHRRDKTKQRNWNLYIKG
jgi:YfiH family protein